MTNLSVTIIQSDLFWEQKNANLSHFESIIGEISTPTDVIILPEMFTTGFSMRSKELAENMTGPTVVWMKEMSRKKQAVIAGSFIVESNDTYFNRFVWVDANGSIQYYDKRHLFTLAGEEGHFHPGDKKLIIDYKGWKICPMICYDLRFPVWSRNTENYDLLIYVANWPETRKLAWRTLLSARAIENQAYVVGVNRIGKDGKGLNYTGESSIIDFGGTILFHNSGSAIIQTITLSKSDLLNYREKLNFLSDRDDFEIKK